MIQFLSLFKYLKDPRVWLGLGVIALGVYIYILNQQIENRDVTIVELKQTIEQRDETITTLRRANTDLVTTIEQYQQDFNEQVQRTNELRELNSQLNRELRERTSDLERAKGRQDIVWQRPTLVERMLQRSWREFVDEISCDSGATEKCD